MMKEIKLSKKAFLITILSSVAVVIAIFYIAFFVGQSNATTELNGEKLKAEQLQEKLNGLNDKISQQNDAYKTAQDQYNSFKEMHKAEFALAGKKDQLTAQVGDAQSQLDSIKSEISDNQSKLNSLKGQVAQASGQLTAAKSAPKTLQAGKYTVGKDIPAGRYKVTAIGTGSNFFVYGGGDETNVLVNTILDTSAGGVSSYTFETSDGDVIQAESAVKLTPLQ